MIFAHIHVQRVGAEIEVTEPVESGIRIVEVAVHIPVEEEAEIDASLRKSALGRGRSGWRRRWVPRPALLAPCAGVWSESVTDDDCADTQCSSDAPAISASM